MKNAEKEKAQESSVRSLTRGLKILNCFDSQTPSFSLTELSAQTGLSVSTLSRLLATLVQCGYLDRGADRRYILGGQVFKLMRAVNNNSNLRAAALPVLQNLRDIFNETASLYAARDNMRVCLESVESTQALHRAVNVGELLPLQQGAVGYMLLAWMPYSQRVQFAKAHEHLSEEMFSAIRKAGYVINDGVQEPGVFAIAAPVFDAQGRNLGVIAVSGPSFRIKESMRRELIVSIGVHSRLISKALGYEE